MLKALAIVLAERLPVSVHCTHAKGHGGTKAAVRSVRGRLALHQFVLKTDVKSYYESIDQRRLLEMLALHVRDRNVLNLLWQVMRRTVTWGGLYRECEQGISRGCPLSPLLGAVFLGALDAAMEKLGMFYARFMDDVLVLTDTHWQLRKAVKVLNGVLSSLGLDKAPDKTFIVRIEKGFDFLGDHFSRAGLAVAARTVQKFIAHAARLYEQERGEEPNCSPRLGAYVRRWLGWVNAGLQPAPES